MFGDDPYYFGTMRKMEIYFSTIFNNILIERKDSANDHKMPNNLVYLEEVTFLVA